MVIRGDTIFALASGRGQAGIAVFRISGAQAHEVVAELCGDVPPARRASLKRLSFEGELIDEALVLIFDEGSSFSGEATAEFHVHGSLAVIRKLEAVLSGIPGFRPAEAGEFTRRALENGRLDLPQVEGLADLIGAETEAQLRQAQRTFSGELGRKIEEWRASLIRASALVEASIDFADEDLPVSLLAEAKQILGKLWRDWEAEIAGSKVAERIRGGFEVALIGEPNTGKSTLVNKIARREVAITSVHPGTTRDVIEVRVDLGGIPVTFLDTAGVRAPGDEVESIGIERTKRRAAEADLRLYLDDSAERYGLSFESGDLRLHGKCDLGKGPGVNISGKTGEGIAEMLEHVQRELEKRVAVSGSATHARHRAALVAAGGHVRAAIETFGRHQPEVVADHLRSSRVELDALLGRVDVEDVLGHIFSSFCIGK